MKKLQVLFYLFLALIIVASCEKTDDDDDDDVFSELTVEENKQNLEDDGLAMLDKMKDMEDDDAVGVVAAMVHFMELADPFAGNPDIEKKNAHLAYMEPVYAVGHVKAYGYQPILKALQSVNDDPESIQEAYNMLVGIYAWNNSTQIWDFTKTGNAIVFEFPSTETGTSNNASLTVSDYSGYTGTIDYDLEDYQGDLPESIKVELAADNSALLNFEFSASYNSNGEPTNVSSSLSFGGYTWSASAYNNGNNDAGMETEWTDGSETILKVSLDATGDWSAENIEENTVTSYDTVYEEIWNPETGEWEQTDVIWYIEEWTEVEGQNIVTEGNALFQAMNTKITGNVKFKELFEGEEEVYANDDDENFDDNAATVAMVDVINENVDLKVRYADNNEIIAVAEAYAYDDTYTDYIWNPATGEYEETLVTEKNIDLRFKFADGSTIDAETYFDEGFEDLIDEFEAWLESLENEWTY